jgi:hypothetical protein
VFPVRQCAIPAEAVLPGVRTAAGRFQKRESTSVSGVTSAPADSPQYCRRLSVTAEMSKQMDLLTIVSAAGVAGYVAIMLTYVARIDLGLSNGQIQFLAIVAAALIALGIAVDFLSQRLSKAE